MNAEILAVGTELLMGQISNTNAQYISNRLPDVGIGVYYHSVVGDNPVRLKEVFDLIIKTFRYCYNDWWTRTHTG